MPATTELTTKALQSSYGSSQTHVFYNSEEYYKTYGRTEYVDTSQSLIGTECLVWITSARSCAHVEGYCEGQSTSTCKNCIRRSGCGWCHLGTYGQGTCSSGSVTSNFGFAKHLSLCPAPRWVFGNWPRYLDDGTFDLLRCEAPRYSNETQTVPTRANAPSDEGMPGHVLAIVIAAFVVISMLLVAVASILLRRTRGIIPRANRTADSSSTTRDARSVNFETIEAEVPFCRPIVLRGGHLRRYARSEANQQEPHEFLQRENTDASNVTNASRVPPCSVCLADLEKGEEGRYLPCKHLFHRQCIDAWLSKSRQCPVCRRDVPHMAAFIAAERDTPGSGGAAVIGLPSVDAEAARQIASGELQELAEEDSDENASDPEEVSQPGEVRLTIEPQALAPDVPRQGDAGTESEALSEGTLSSDVATEGVPAIMSVTGSPRPNEIGLSPPRKTDDMLMSPSGFDEVASDMHLAVERAILTSRIQELGSSLSPAGFDEIASVVQPAVEPVTLTSRIQELGSFAGRPSNEHSAVNVNGLNGLVGRSAESSQAESLRRVALGEPVGRVALGE